MAILKGRKIFEPYDKGKSIELSKNFLVILKFCLQCDSSRNTSVYQVLMSLNRDGTVSKNN